MGADEERQKLLRQIDEALARIDSTEEPSTQGANLDPDAEETDAVALAKERAELENRSQP